MAGAGKPPARKMSRVTDYVCEYCGGCCHALERRNSPNMVMTLSEVTSNDRTAAHTVAGTILNRFIPGRRNPTDDHSYSP